MIQEQYWKELHQLKAHICFIELLLEKAEKIDRFIKGIIAVSSSTSIGAWAIWNQYSWLWAGIIAFSQIVSAVNPFLPYSSRIKEYTALLNEFEEIMIQAEFKWHPIAEGQFTANKINKARFEIKVAKQKSLKKNIPTTIPIDNKLQEKAEKAAIRHFDNFYSS